MRFQSCCGLPTSGLGAKFGRSQVCACTRVCVCVRERVSYRARFQILSAKRLKKCRGRRTESALKICTRPVRLQESRVDPEVERNEHQTSEKEEERLFFFNLYVK